MLSRFSHVWLFATLWTVACQAPLSMGFSMQEYCSSKNSEVGSHSLLQGILPTQGLNQLSHIAGRFFTIWAIMEAPFSA